ncbi:hypothetical protein B0E38_04723 [Streptomyces sp. 111WW2]|nr:hypothetical protein B0E38_04723 [Streptomyces sp. 111WW2]
MPTLDAQRVISAARKKGDTNATGGVNASAIARRTRITRSTVTRLLTGETEPSVMSLLAMRRAYGISLDDLVLDDAEVTAGSTAIPS